MRFLFLALLLASSPLPQAFALNAPVTATSIRSSLRRDLEKSQHLSFAALLSDWESRYGTRAVSPLLELAALRSLQDHERYTALMGAARLGGRASAPLLTPFLSDSSWMMRAGTLRALTALKNPATSSAPLKLLNDPALVVRLEAVESVAKLRPEGSIDALVSAIASPSNYHGHHAQWVPQKAFEALKSLDLKKSAPKLAAVVSRVDDPELRKQISAGLSSKN